MIFYNKLSVLSIAYFTIHEKYERKMCEILYCLGKEISTTFTCIRKYKKGLFYCQKNRVCGHKSADRKKSKTGQKISARHTPLKTIIYLTKSTNLPPVIPIRRALSSSTCMPTLPPLTNIILPSAELSKNVGKSFFMPTGEQPP